jgi:hypothetical protein
VYRESRFAGIRRQNLCSSAGWSQQDRFHSEEIQCFDDGADNTCFAGTGIASDEEYYIIAALGNILSNELQSFGLVGSWGVAKVFAEIVVYDSVAHSEELLVAGCWLLVTGYWLLVTGYWLLVTWFIVYRLLFIGSQVGCEMY